MVSRVMSSPKLPPPMKGDLRTILVQTALANPSLMAGLTNPADAARRAVAIADEMLKALACAGPPIVESLTEEEMDYWEEAIKKQRHKKINNSKNTEPAIPSMISKKPTTILPPPSSVHGSRRHASRTRRTPTLPWGEIVPPSQSKTARFPDGPGVYKHVNVFDDDENGH